MRVLRTKGFVLVVLAAIFIPITTSGCFGRFQLTRKIYGFNRDLSSDRWVRWFGFLILNFIPVYLAAGVIDLVFGNSLEFWGGRSPFASSEPQTRYAYGPNGELISASVIELGVVELRVSDRHGTTHVLRVVRERDALAAYDESGRLVARVGDVGGVAGLLERAP